MKSIQRNFAFLSFVSIVLFALVLGGVSVFALVSKTDEDATVTMNLVCANEADQIDKLFEGIEDSVETEATYVGGRLQELGGTDEHASWLNEVQEFFSSVAEHTEGSVCYYLRLNDATDGTQGFFYLRDELRDEFRAAPVSEEGALLPGEGAADQVGWNEGALRAGKALWLAPHEVGPLGILTTTYVAPVFVNGAYAGVMGMGVDFQVVIDKVSNINVYKKGYGFLTDAVGNVMYHPAIPYGTNLADDGEDVPAVDAAIAAGTTVDDVVVYKYQGVDKRMAFHLLQNDMRLVLSVDASEIYAGRDQLVTLFIIISVLSAVLFAVASQLLSRKALKPLSDLTTAAERVADGDLSVSLPQSDVYEVSRLVGAYDRTVGELRDQLALIDSLAHLDSLTGLFNKAAYDEAAARLNAMIAAGEEPEFSVVMLDLNGLKETNDTYGHEAGDLLLQRAVAVMSDMLAGYPVYRVGGDEFVAIVEGEPPVLEGIEHDDVSIACGVATYRAGADASVAEVLARADEAMYACKHAMKE